MIYRAFCFLAFIYLFQISAIADTKVYTVFVCSGTTYEEALSEKNYYIKNPKADAFIIRSEAGSYRVAYGMFKNVSDAESFRRTLPKELKKLKPYVEKLTVEYLSQTKQGKVVSFPLKAEALDDNIHHEILKAKLDNNITFLESEKNCTKQIILPILSDIKTYNPKNLDRIVVYINSIKNYMTVKGYKNDQELRFKTYKVSSAKINVKKPKGVGYVSAISLHPVWYPTTNTLDYFKNVRKIELPKAIPPESPYNYMGAAKISLTHVVDGRQTYRIHGTINERTIGKHESDGCIRMKNEDVLVLARFLKEFSSARGIKRILVIMD